MTELPPESKLSVRNFTKDDFGEYQSWFLSEALNEHLGPAPDQLWLDQILYDGEGAQLVVLDDDEIVAVVGVCFATPKNPFQVITDIAINPKLARQGVGSLALNEVLSQTELDEDYSWRTFVDEKNPDAMAFFKKNQWDRFEYPDADGMYAFTKTG